MKTYFQGPQAVDIAASSKMDNREEKQTEVDWFH
jgi:hypothetical protein